MAIVLPLFAWSLAIAVLVAIVILVPYLLYTIPYSFWCGFADADTRYPATKDCGLWRTVCNATKLYKHWIFRTELRF